MKQASGVGYEATAPNQAPVSVPSTPPWGRRFGNFSCVYKTIDELLAAAHVVRDSEGDIVRGLEVDHRSDPVRYESSSVRD